MNNCCEPNNQTAFDVKKLVALAGNPNVGKSTLFNELTGAHQKIANYPGVTVEKHIGTLTTTNGQSLTIIDLPGTYSLNTKTEDEAVAANVILGRDLHSSLKRPDVVVVVVEATKLARSLLLFEQIRQVHPQVLLAVNMMDELMSFKLKLDVAKLATLLNTVVVPMTARNGVGVCELIDEIEKMPVLAANTNKDDATILSTLDTQAAFKKIDGIVARVLIRDTDATNQKARVVTDNLDRILLHPVMGPLIFMFVMLTFFQALFTWSAPLMDLVDGGFVSLGASLAANIQTPWLASLVSDGIFAGVGSVLVFVPQIAIAFVIIGFLEMSGYLARGAFLIDRLMRFFGLEGRAFIPLISSFACAIPGIMATRTMPHPRQRLVTTLIAPLMTCSARLPVYTLLIACFVPATTVAGVFSYQGFTLFGLFIAGIVMAMLVSLVLNKIFAKSGAESSFFMELPRYRLPTFKSLYHYVSFRTWSFVKTAGTVIFILSTLLWALAYFPRPDAVHAEYETQRAALQSQNLSPEDLEMKTIELDAKENGAYLRQSFMGRAGHAIEPLIKPLGYDWKLGIGVLTSFAAREVFVSTMGIVYNIGDADENSGPLREKITNAKKEDGSPAYTLATALSLLIFYAFAAQCVSTLAVIKRETGSIKWAFVSFGYMTVLAYVSAVVVYNVAHIMIS